MSPTRFTVETTLPQTQILDCTHVHDDIQRISKLWGRAKAELRTRQTENADLKEKVRCLKSKLKRQKRSQVEGDDQIVTSMKKLATASEENIKLKHKLNFLQHQVEEMKQAAKKMVYNEAEHKILIADKVKLEISLKHLQGDHARLLKEVGKLHNCQEDLEITRLELDSLKSEQRKHHQNKSLKSNRAKGEINYDDCQNPSDASSTSTAASGTNHLDDYLPRDILRTATNFFKESNVNLDMKTLLLKFAKIVNDVYRKREIRLTKETERRVRTLQKDSKRRKQNSVPYETVRSRSKQTFEKTLMKEEKHEHHDELNKLIKKYIEPLAKKNGNVYCKGMKKEEVHLVELVEACLKLLIKK